jgi:hypothetical protein
MKTEIEAKFLEIDTVAIRGWRGKRRSSGYE